MVLDLLGADACLRRRRGRKNGAVEMDEGSVPVGHRVVVDGGEVGFEGVGRGEDADGGE